MNIELAQAIAGEDPDIEVREDYSGRGMYGEKTAAVVYDNEKQLIKAVAHVAYQLGAMGSDSDWIDDLERLRFDSMGRGMVAY